MKNLLTMVLLVFSLGLYAETLPPESVTNDKDFSVISIDDGFDVFSVADYSHIIVFDFYGNFSPGKKFINVNERKNEMILETTFCPVNDVGKEYQSCTNILAKQVSKNIEKADLIYRRSRDGLMCYSARLV